MTIGRAFSAIRWEQMAASYRQLASGQRMLLEGEDFGGTVATAALRQLTALGVRTVFLQDESEDEVVRESDESKLDPVRLAADLAAATAEMEAMPGGLDKAETRMVLNLVHCAAGLAEMGTLGVDSGMELLAILKQGRQGRDPAAGR